MTFFPDVTFRVFARNPVPSAVGPTRLTTDNEENVRWMAVKSGPIAHPRLSNGSNTNTLDGDMTDSPLGHSAKVWRRDGKSMRLTEHAFSMPETLPFFAAREAIDNQSTGRQGESRV
jgi:hypothetical protein